MVFKRHKRAERIREELECPQCSYSLRGLDGERIICPECAQSVDVGKLLAVSWNRPFFEAPLYNTVALPLAVVVFASLGVFIYFFMNFHRPHWPAWHWIALAVLPLAMALWLLFMWYVRRRFGSDEGVRLALLVHWVFPAYILGIAMGGWGGLWFTLSLSWPINFRMIRYGLIALIGVGLYYSGRRIERYVGHRCIQRYVRLSVAAKPTGTESGQEIR